MPCIKCSNGKWRYGSGKCQFDTKKKCEDAAAAIHIGDENKSPKKMLGLHADLIVFDECCKDCAENNTTLADVVIAEE